MSARFTYLRNAIAEQIVALAAYSAPGQVVIGSDAIPAEYPGWRVTMATGTGAPITYNKRQLDVLVYVQLFLGPFDETQEDRQDLVMANVEAILPESVLGQTVLQQRVATLTAAESPPVSSRGWSPAWTIEPLDVHDDPRVQEAELPDAQIGIRVKYTVS